MQDDKNLNRLMKDKYTPKGTRFMILIRRMFKIECELRDEKKRVKRRYCHYTENCNSNEVGRDDHSEYDRITGLKDDGMRD